MTVYYSEELPMGFGAELIKNVYAMEFFSSLPGGNQRAIIEQARSITSGSEMRNFVNGLAQH